MKAVSRRAKPSVVGVVVTASVGWRACTPGAKTDMNEFMNGFKLTLAPVKRLFGPV
jgi:hypothetical protein